MEASNRKFVSYARISTNLQNQTSIKDQQRRINLWAQSFDDVIVAEFDDTASGANRNREGFNAALSLVLTCFCLTCGDKKYTVETVATFATTCAACGVSLNYNRPCRLLKASGRHLEPANKTDGMIVSHVDRFARDVAHMAAIMRQFDDAGKVLRIHELGLDTSNHTGQMVVSFMSAVAQFSRAQTREKSISVCKWLKEQGLYAAGGPQYGKKAIFHWVSGKKVSEHRLVDDEKEMEAVRLIRRAYLRGKTGTQIARELNAAGFKTKHGFAFTPMQVIRVLQYEGLYKPGRKSEVG